MNKYDFHDHKNWILVIMKISLTLVGIFFFSISTIQAQFTLSGQYRPRAEYRHGFKQLPQPGQDAAFFIDQRSRINLDYKSSTYDIRVVLQDVRVWGSQPQLVVADGATTTIHEAWGLLKFNEKVGLKLGRQEIIYDDSRIFGNVGWAQQARSHDAAILRIRPEGTKIDVGLAYNQNGAALAGNFYTVSNSYKTFQYLWAQKDFGNIKASFLFLNLGNQGGDPITNNDKTYYQQTLGGRLVYKKDALGANAAIYGQFGDMADGSSSVKGLLYSLDINYALTDKHKLTAGIEHISGNDKDNPSGSGSNEDKAFNPYFGTNHKFNGLMDYFYVGNHTGSVGLNDIQFGYKGTFTEKFSAGLMTHLFYSDGKIFNLNNPQPEAMSKSLGTEIDLTASYKMSSDVNLAFGYSQMFGSETLMNLRGGDKDETSNWAWVMISFNPTFFTTKENKE